MEHRFLSKFIKTDGCWNWTACKIKAGYGQINIDGKMQLAHRVSYEMYKNKIPEGLHVRHSCDNPSCVNPDHLELGTNQDNVNDRTKRGRHKYGISKGEKHGLAKLTEADVLEIRQMIQNGVYHKIIAELFDVSPSLICRINTGKNWSHI